MNFIKLIIQYLSVLIPKRNYVVITPFPNWEDMVIAIYDEIKSNAKIKKIIWLTIGNPQKPCRFVPTQNTVFVKKSSIKGIWYLISSKYIFFTHGTIFLKRPVGQVVVNLWHGFGFKAVGTHIGSEGCASSYCIASSRFSQDLFASQMNLDKSQVISLGFARNDRLLNAYAMKKDLCTKLGLSKHRSILFWMPTYRNSTIGVIRKDGKQYDNPYNLEVFDVNRFDEFLESNNVLCLFKPHPMALKFSIKSTDNFKVITEDWLDENSISLYQLLGCTDVLISDISSVITDYLLIDKPIIHAMSDLEEYKESRALLLNPPEKYLVGPLVKDQNGLERELENILDGVDMYKVRREELKHLFFDENIDNKSSKRILNLINL